MRGSLDVRPWETLSDRASRVSRNPGFCPVPSLLAKSCFHFWFSLVHGSTGIGDVRAQDWVTKLLRQEVALLYDLTDQPLSSSLNMCLS